MTWQSGMADPNSVLNDLPGFPQLQGPRIRLRGPRVEDAAAVFEVFSDPAVMRYWSSTPMRELAQAEGRIAEILDGFTQRRLINWVVVDRRDAVIGTCTLYNFVARHRRAELGYALRSDCWGKGLAREATTLAIDWAFRTLELHRIEADIDPRNEASRKVLERLGFASEGVMRERFFIGDDATDSEIFGLLVGDWAARQR